jgi:16S rRNA (adenine1518-N6/adenine1519-N6)-dimethyltransferase
MLKMVEYLSQIKSLLKKYHLKPRKDLGQYFLIDDEVVNKLIKAADLSSCDIVIEIGPGLGIPLTYRLCEKAGQVIAVEIDKKMAEITKKTSGEFKNLEVINEDILKIKKAATRKSLRDKQILNIKNYKIISSLPYYITSPVLRKFLETEKKPEFLVLLVQKEIAEKVTACPPDMSILAVSVQFYGKAEIIDYVPKDSFYPAPSVDSAIIKIKVSQVSEVSQVSDVRFFFQIVKAGFSERRKQLKNSLAGGLQIDQKQIIDLLKRSQIDPTRRAETLSLSEWVNLYREMV